MSCPRIRAVPEVGLWNPSSVLISVDFPAPFGPSSPIERPVSDAFSLFKIVRLPKRTSSPSSSMTGSITPPYAFGAPGVPPSSSLLHLPHLPPRSELHGSADQPGEVPVQESRKTLRQHVAAGRDRNPVALGIRRHQHRLQVLQG